MTSPRAGVMSDSVSVVTMLAGRRSIGASNQLSLDQLNPAIFMRNASLASWKSKMDSLGRGSVRGGPMMRDYWKAIRKPPHRCYGSQKNNDHRCCGWDSPKTNVGPKRPVPLSKSNLSGPRVWNFGVLAASEPA